MITTRLKSSNLRAASHNPFTAKLTIEFHNDRVYEYGCVPSLVFTGLVQAKSPGGYFARHILGHYPFRKLK